MIFRVGQADLHIHPWRDSSQAMSDMVDVWRLVAAPLQYTPNVLQDEAQQSMLCLMTYDVEHFLEYLRFRVIFASSW